MIFLFSDSQFRVPSSKLDTLPEHLTPPLCPFAQFQVSKRLPHSRPPCLLHSHRFGCFGLTFPHRVFSYESSMHLGQRMQLHLSHCWLHFFDFSPHYAQLCTCVHPFGCGSRFAVWMRITYSCQTPPCLLQVPNTCRVQHHLVGFISRQRGKERQSFHLQ